MIRIIFLLVAIVSTAFAFIAGILFAIASAGVPAAFGFIHTVIGVVAIIFWIRSKGLVPVVSHGNAESGQEYQEW